jgi:hypothetical protein
MSRVCLPHPASAKPSRRNKRDDVAPQVYRLCRSLP